MRSSAYLAIAFAACASTPALSESAVASASASAFTLAAAAASPRAALLAARPPFAFSADTATGDASLLAGALLGVLAIGGSPRAGRLRDPRAGGGGIPVAFPRSSEDRADASRREGGFSALFGGFSALFGAFSVLVLSAFALALFLRSRYLFTALTDRSDFMFSPLTYSPTRLQSWKGCSSRVVGSKRL